MKNIFIYKTSKMSIPVLNIIKKYLDFTLFYTQTRHTTGTGPFTRRNIEDVSLVTTTSVAIKF